METWVAPPISLWINKERFEQLVHRLFLFAAPSGLSPSTPGKKITASDAATLHDRAQTLLERCEAAGYQVGTFVACLA